LKSVLTALVNSGEAPQRLSCYRMTVLLKLFGQKKHDQRGNNGSRKEIGRKEREYDGLSERNEKVPRHAGEKKHRNEHNADADRGVKSRHGDLLGAIENGLPKLLPHGHIALHIFDFDRRVVD